MLSIVYFIQGTTELLTHAPAAVPNMDLQDLIPFP